MKTTLAEYINSWFSESTITLIKQIADGAWATVCMIGVPAGAVLILSMANQHPSVVSINSVNGVPTMIVSPTSPSYVSSPVTLGDDIKKAVYKAYIKDDTGKIVYRFPEFVTSHPGQAISFKMPPLKAGTYYVKADIIYALNPIKTSTLDIELARVVSLDNRSYDDANNRPANCRNAGC